MFYLDSLFGREQLRPRQMSLRPVSLSLFVADHF